MLASQGIVVECAAAIFFPTVDSCESRNNKINVSLQMKAIVLISLQIFFCNALLGNILGYSPVLAREYSRSRDVFRPIASENI